jgi:hypothetical protein
MTVKLKFINDNITGRVIVEHTDVNGIEYEVIFSMSLFRKGKKSNDFLNAPSPFDILNRYLSRQSDDKLIQIFNFYRKASTILDDERDYKIMSEKLADEITTLSKIVTVDDMLKWVKHYGDIRVPKDLVGNFEDFEDKSLVTLDRTYVRSDYIDLVAWMLCLRFIAPIWSVYIEKTGDKFGTTWKLFYAYDLISNSGYNDCAAEKKLSRYVALTIPPSTDLNSIVLTGVSKSDYFMWLLSQVVIRRVVLADIDNDPDNTPIIKIIYKFITQKIQQQDKQFSGTVKVTGNDDSSGPTDNDTTSILERYSSRQTLSDGEITTITFYLRPDNIEGIVQKIDPTIPIDLVYTALESSDRLLAVAIEEAQMLLTKWIINRVIPAKIIDYIPREALLVAMSIAAAWYWHHGYHSLSLLTLASKVENIEEHQLTGTEKRSRIVKDMYDRLAVDYPYYQQNTGKKTDRPKLGVIVSIEYLERLLTNSDWYTYVPNKWIENSDISLMSRHYNVPENIKTMLVNLAGDLVNLTPLKSPY